MDAAPGNAEVKLVKPSFPQMHVYTGNSETLKTQDIDVLYIVKV